MDPMVNLMPTDAIMPSRSTHASSFTCPATSSSSSSATRRKLRSCVILALACNSNVPKADGHSEHSRFHTYQSTSTAAGDCIISNNLGHRYDAEHHHMHPLRHTHLPHRQDLEQYDHENPEHDLRQKLLPIEYVQGKFRDSGSFSHQILPSAQLSPPEKPIKHACSSHRGSFDDVSIAGVGLPPSLKMLKRKQKKVDISSRTSTLANTGVAVSVASGLVDHFGNSLQSAFSSIVFMMKTLQRHTLVHIKQHLLEKEIIEGLVSRVNREMHSSLLWLFQQVFSCTPQLMILVMVFLTDFTVFSMASNLHIPSHLAPPSTISSTLLSDQNTEMKANLVKNIEMFMENPLTIQSTPSFTHTNMERVDQILDDRGWFGNGGRRSIGKVVGGGYGDSNGSPSSNDMHNRAAYSRDKTSLDQISSAPSTSTIGSEKWTISGLSPSMNLKSSSRDKTDILFNMDLPSKDEEGELKAQSVVTSKVTTTQENAMCSSDLGNKNTINHDLVEEDNHPSYDRTDLAYQYAISNHDSTVNAMVLANYAQFLFLVRKDHDRAEELFKRALRCDPSDGDTIHRFASFLWLARDDRIRAEKAYESAINTDPHNPFFAASYAHFLWDAHKC